jgi:hypothetical protein
MRTVRAGDLNDVPIWGRFESSEEVIAGRQDLGANARNLDGYAKCDSRITSLLVGLRCRGHEKTDYDEA